MSAHPLAGKPAQPEMLVNIPRLVSAYYTRQAETPVSFGTSGHRGSSLNGSFNEAHILAVCQAVSEMRKQKGINGPLFIGMDTHALSEPALQTAMEVFTANGDELFVQENMGYTPTPVISHAILRHNSESKRSQADGVVITPSHNPPQDGGFKYNPPAGGPAGTDTTAKIQQRANEIMQNSLKDVKRSSHSQLMGASSIHWHDYITPFLKDLASVIDMETIAGSGIRIGVDPLGGSGIGFWEPMAEMYGLKLELVNRHVDPAFSFMTVDHDGKIRMDCSSPYAMAGLIKLKDSFDISFGNDPDFDRHGIVTPTAGLINPNHYLAVAIWYLYRNRPAWRKAAGIGKTLVSSSMIDRVAADLNRTLLEVPVGFKWFVDGLFSGDIAFGGEESAGASFLRKDGGVWTTDKDGIILDLLAAEITAKTGHDPAQHYKLLQEKFGSPVYERIDAPAAAEEKQKLKSLSPDDVGARELGGETITAKLTRAPGNKAEIGGLKVTTENGWFAARPSGTEDIYKIYAESFKGPEHLKQIQDEAREIVSKALK